MQALLFALAAAWFVEGETKYVQDLDFIADTVAANGAAVAVHRLDWAGLVAAHRPRFEGCTNDVEHVKNVMRLLAELGDSHTGVTRHGVDKEALPSKWDELFGGGLWFAWEDGRVMLRGVMEGMQLGHGIAPGAALVTIDGWPAWLALEREKRRITEFAGSSSDHSLFASMGNRLLPFGAKRTLTLGFCVPGERGVRVAEVPQWGPGGKAFQPLVATLPPGVDAEGEGVRAGAVATVLATEWCSKVGYVRITGSMDDATVAAFHAAFDTLRDVEAVLLDCRGMGGGSDGAAWAMCGRFFSRGVANGIHGRIEASGTWQFDGPLVMLQDELEVSAAETFTWALCETKRCVSVGRPTGGWAIIPKGYKCPSGLVDFRLGVNARPTPIERRATEGIGWTPDVLVPYGPRLCAEHDATRRIGLETLRLLHSGVERDEVAAIFGDLFGGGLDEAAKRAARTAKSIASRAAKETASWDYAALVELVRRDLEATLALELALLEESDVIAPDVRGAERRLVSLEQRAKGAKLASPLAALQSALKRQRAESAAQAALLEFEGHGFEGDQRAVKSFLTKHAKSRIASFARDVLFVQ
jgi:hypothetical protein